VGSPDSSAPAATIDEETSLREALDLLVLTGAPRINVTRGGVVVGSIDQAAISAALGAGAPARRTESE
jgi:osmoprotectant transport system ATP-binding protein